MGPAVSRLQVESDKKHAMTQESWDSRVDHAVFAVKIRILISPNCFVHMNAYMCTSMTAALILITRLDSRMLQ